MAKAEMEVINSVLKNNDVASLHGDAGDYVTALSDVWTWIKDYYDNYRVLPGVELVSSTFPDFEEKSVSGNSKYYVDQLREEYVQSSIENLLMKAATAQDKGVPSSEILSKMTAKLSKLNHTTGNVRDVNVTDIDAAKEHYEKVRERAEKGGAVGIRTGIPSIDACYPTGMSPGHLITLIGWSGRGKSWFAAYLAIKAWEQGYRPMIVSLEMSPESMRDRIYTMMGSGLFDISDFAQGAVSTDTLNEWSKKKFDRVNDFIIVSSEGYGDVTPNTVQSKIDQYNPDFAVMDYHQLFSNNGKSASPVERAMAVSREFKLLAVTNGIPLVDITAATSKGDLSDRDEPPSIGQVAWSKAIEYDSDLAISVHLERSDPDIKRELERLQIRCEKNRHGPMFDFDMEVNIAKGIWKESHVPRIGL